MRALRANRRPRAPRRRRSLVLMGSSPFKNLLGVQAAFAPFAMPGVDLGAAKLLYTMLSEARWAWRSRARCGPAPRAVPPPHPPHAPTNPPARPPAADLAGCGVFFWKLHAMGLMPLTSSDWISLLPVRTQADYSSSVDALGIA
jgi:hypothetical protein